MEGIVEVVIRPVVAGGHNVPELLDQQHIVGPAKGRTVPGSMRPDFLATVGSEGLTVSAVKVVQPSDFRGLSGAHDQVGSTSVPASTIVIKKDIQVGVRNPAVAGN